MSRSHKYCIKAYLGSKDEKKQITELAASANISVSELVKRAVLGQRLPETSFHQDIVDLVKVAADLARLGNLFKLALDDEDFLMAQKTQGLDAFTIGHEINQLRHQLKTKIAEIKAS